MLAIKEEKLRRKASTSLYEFVVQAWHVAEPAIPLRGNWHIGAICEHLQAVSQGQIRRLVINVPPRSTKSTAAAVMWPAWEWIHWPAHRWLCGSHKLALAIRDNLAMRRLIQSPWYQRRWGRQFNLVDNSDWGDPRGFELTADQNQKTRFDNDRAGRRIAFGFESGVTGEGGGRILIDDPHDRNQAHSDAERESSIVTFREGISTRLDDPASDPIVIVMQRLHEFDLSGFVLSLGGWDHLLIPMHYDPTRSSVTTIGWRDPRREVGELLDPERFSIATVTEMEVLLGDAAAGQLEQRPAPATGAIFNPAWWQFYDEEPAKYDVECQSWDMAVKGTVTSNFVAGQAWGKCGANCYYKPDPNGGIYKQIDFTVTLEEFRAFSKTHPYPAKLIEDKANGPAIISTLKGEIPGILPMPNDGGAEAIARSVAPYVKAGNVWLPNPYAVPVGQLKRNAAGVVMPDTPVNPERRWVLRFIQNATTFPNGSIPAGSHGDDVVAAVQAVHYLLHPKVKSDGYGVVGFYRSFQG